MALFALDHNYPSPIIAQARPYLGDVELVSIDNIDSRLPEFEDWKLLLALHHHEREWDGMISNDTSMLEQERELAVLGYTHLSLIAPVSVGHDPIRSTGLVMAHIGRIAAQTTQKKPQVWKLAGRTPTAQHPNHFMERLAERVGVDPIDLRKKTSPSNSDLRRNPLS